MLKDIFFDMEIIYRFIKYIFDPSIKSEIFLMKFWVKAYVKHAG